MIITDAIVYFPKSLEFTYRVGQSPVNSTVKKVERMEIKHGVLYIYFDDNSFNAFSDGYLVDGNNWKGTPDE